MVVFFIFFEPSTTRFPSKLKELLRLLLTRDFSEASGETVEAVGGLFFSAHLPFDVGVAKVSLPLCFFKFLFLDLRALVELSAFDYTTAMADNVAFGEDVAAFAIDVRAGDNFEGVWLGDLRLVLDDEAFDFDGDGDTLLARFAFEPASDFADPSLTHCFDLVLPRALAVACLPLAALDLTMVHSKIWFIGYNVYVFMNDEKNEIDSNPSLSSHFIAFECVQIHFNSIRIS